MWAFSGSQRSQTELHVVCEPDGLGGGVPRLLAWPDGSGQVAEVVSDLERHPDIRVPLLLGHHFDEEADLVGFPEGDHTADRTGRVQEVRI